MSRCLAHKGVRREWTLPVTGHPPKCRIQGRGIEMPANDSHVSKVKRTRDACHHMHLVHSHLSLTRVHSSFRQQHDLPFSGVTLARLTYSQSCSSMIHRICSDFSRSLPFYKVACLLRPPISKRITLLHRRRWHFATPPRPIYRLV